MLLDARRSDVSGLSVYVLGHFRVRRDGEPLALGRKVPWRPLQLLQAIAVLGPREASATGIVTALWPDAEGDAGSRAFEIALHRLRRLLGDPDAVRYARGRIGLDNARVWVDAEAFEQLAARVEQARDTAALARAVGLYEGAVLAGHDDAAWLLPVRERLRSRFLRMAARGASLLEENGWREAAVDLLRRALEREPLAEELHRGLIRALMTLDRRAEAVEAYRHCERLLEQVLGVRPSSDTRRACGEAPPP
jgi:DNA-binding SARP family transcriptional activator